MKRVLTISGSFLLILVAVYCTMGALISAFSFGVELRSLYPAWLIAALLLAVFASFLRGKGILLLMIPLVILLLLKSSEIIDGAKWTVYSITSEYNKWLNIPVVFPGAASATQYELTLFYSAAGIILAYLLSISICLQRSAFHTIVFTAPVVFLTVVLIETAPDSIFLLGLLAVYLTLLISSSMHPYNFNKSGSSVFIALILSLILMGAAYLVAPPDRYERNELVENLDYYIRNVASDIGLVIDRTGIGWPVSASGVWRFSTDSVGISNAGARMISDRSILEVTSTRAGTFYLKGFSMLDFDGREWRNHEEAHQRIGSPLPNVKPALIADAYSWLYGQNSDLVQMTITKTGDSSNMIYQPYYSMPYTQSSSDSYSVIFYYVNGSVMGHLNRLLNDESIEFYDIDVSGYNKLIQAPSEYTKVDEHTAEGLRQLALEVGIDPSADRTEIVDKVASYVLSSARYTLTPYVIPEGEDFALHFLQTSKRGYCIHFATAATLMLRALDVPARYASGFVVTVSPGSVDSTVVVTDRSAHAWVEVYYDDIGWIPLEVTPSTPGSGAPGGVSIAGSVQASAAPEYQPGSISDEYDDMWLWDDDYPYDYNPSSGQGSGAESSQAGSVGFAEQYGFALIVISCAAVCIVAMVVRSAFARSKRRKLFAQPDTNAAVIFAWRYVTRIERADEAPKDMENLALKARFSQHRITEEERAAMIDSAVDYAAKAYRKQSFLKRLIFKHIRGL